MLFGIGTMKPNRRFQVSSFFLFVFFFISQRPQLGYVNKYKQHNIEQNKAMNLKICNNTDLNISTEEHI